MNSIGKRKGVLLVVISTLLWAINGNIASYLFKSKSITPEHLTMFRLVFSGAILLVYEFYKNNWEVFKIFEEKHYLFRLIYFAIFGLLAMQYGYFVATKYSNAATATILQSLAPFFIVLIKSIVEKKLPKTNIIVSLFLALFGVFLFVTQGKIGQIVITKLAMVFGLIAAIGSVNYNLSSNSLQRKFNTKIIMAWAMVIAGILFTIFFRPFNSNFRLTFITTLGIIYVVLFGTLIPFLFYLIGVNLIGPEKASILCLLEPVVATLIAVIFLGEGFLVIDYIGIASVIVALFLLNRPEER